ncbi:MAG: hypothetical protein U0Z44_04280 [Kouleothrix sp.]
MSHGVVLTGSAAPRRRAAPRWGCSRLAGALVRCYNLIRVRRL